MPHFDGASGSETESADSWYHGLQMKWEKRFSKGLTMLAHYTWAKMLDDVSNGSGNLDWLSNTSGSNLQTRLDYRLEKSLLVERRGAPFRGHGRLPDPVRSGQAAGRQH